MATTKFMAQIAASDFTFVLDNAGTELMVRMAADFEAVEFIDGDDNLVYITNGHDWEYVKHHFDPGTQQTIEMFAGFPW